MRTGLAPTATLGIDLLVGDDTGGPYTEWALGDLAPVEVKIMDGTNCVYVKKTGTQAILHLLRHIGADTCVFMALFNGSTPPTESDFSTTYDALGTNERMASTSPDGKFAGESSDGVNIPLSGGEKLYFYCRAPDPNSKTNRHDIKITIGTVAY